MESTPRLLIPEWPAPANVQAAVTTRIGGQCRPPFAAFNVAQHVGDVAATVARNRQMLRDALALPVEPCWLEQVHGRETVAAESGAGAAADASYTRTTGVACTVMVADCLPLLICDSTGSQVAAAHAGWKGLAGGVIESILVTFPDPSDVMVWLGPAIGPCHYEVGAEVKAAFEDGVAGFAPSARRGHWMMDLYALARSRLARAGVKQVFGGDLCTYCDEERFYSYRRDGQTGRIAALIWLAAANPG